MGLNDLLDQIESQPLKDWTREALGQTGYDDFDAPLLRYRVPYAGGLEVVRNGDRHLLETLALSNALMLTFYRDFLPTRATDETLWETWVVDEFPLWMDSVGGSLRVEPVVSTFYSETLMDRRLEYAELRLRVAPDGSRLESYDEGRYFAIFTPAGPPLFFQGRDGDDYFFLDNDATLACPACHAAWYTDDGYHWYPVRFMNGHEPRLEQADYHQMTIWDASYDRRPRRIRRRWRFPVPAQTPLPNFPTASAPPWTIFGRRWQRLFWLDQPLAGFPRPLFIDDDRYLCPTCYRAHLEVYG